MSSQDFKPFVPPESKIPELGIVPILMGIILGIVFGASSLYLALKVGMTVSASIPVAVLSITLFRWLSKMFKLRPATILENNIVQTTGSAGESIAFGVAVTMPALLILGFDMEVTRTMVVACLGGLLGILMMVPLRYALVVKSHGVLPFPEGTACAEVLIAGEKGGTTAKTVFAGFFVGLVYKVLNVGSKLWVEAPSALISWFKGAAVSAEVSPELLGVGYIIGPRIACITVAGGILSSWVLIPMITLFGQHQSAPLFPATKLIAEMSVHEIWRNYILYIGAGAVAAGGIISLIQSFPTIVRSLVAGLSGLKSQGVGAGLKTLRTERELPMPVVIGGILAIIIAIWALPQLHMNFIGALLITTFGFLFVTVASRIVGEIGSSSNPISGMTVATLLFTSLIFLAFGWTSPTYRVAALMVAGIVCVASALAGATTQDLKCGHIIGATPFAQQIGILAGALSSALVIGYTLVSLNDSSTVYSQKNLPNVTVPNVQELTKTEKVSGPEAKGDETLYHVLRISEGGDNKLPNVSPGKYLVNDAGKIVYLVDPGINGTLTARDDGTAVQKYEAPKARLMSLIIDGILSRKLPWGLVLLGVSIALVLQLCRVSPLVFAVGVYLPLATTMPIFVGGVVRYLIERRSKSKSAEEDDASPGVLFSSGLIAGGAICGIVLAILLVKEGWGKAIDFSTVIPTIAESNWTAVIAFAVLIGSLFYAARKKSDVVK
jgi:putative OPT family oligopeptide transporter